MPPVVSNDIVVPDYLVANIARLARQIESRKPHSSKHGHNFNAPPKLLYSVMIATAQGAYLPRLDDRDIVVGRLGEEPPSNAPLEMEDVKECFLLLKQKQMVLQLAASHTFTICYRSKFVKKI